ncbi:MAG: hypothetical protein ABJB11_16495 [Ferruginibacter sp.]
MTANKKLTTMIIDVHTHINNYHKERVVSLKNSLNLLTETMAANKVDYSLVPEPKYIVYSGLVVWDTNG